MTALQRFFLIEKKYESGQCNSNVDAGFLENALFNLHQRHFESFYLDMMSALNQARQAKDENQQIFCLYWMIVGTEIQYDLVARKKFINELENVECEEFNLYHEYCLTYFQSISYFFDGQLDESLVVLDKAVLLAERVDYHRGKARCLYQKALIAEEKKDFQAFHQAYAEALSYALAEDLKKTTFRIRCLLPKKDDEFLQSSSIEALVEKIDKAQLSGDWKYARLLLIEAERSRRRDKISRQRHSLFYYRIKNLILESRVHYARKLLTTVRDKVLLFKLLSFLSEQGFALTKAEVKRHNQLRFQISGLILQNIQKIYLKKIKNIYIRRLVQALWLHPSLDKEALFQNIYQQSYDPMAHDIKIYKLIMRAKKEISSNLIINSYGKYEFNRKDFEVAAG